MPHGYGSTVTGVTRVCRLICDCFAFATGGQIFAISVIKDSKLVVKNKLVKNKPVSYQWQVHLLSDSEATACTGTAPAGSAFTVDLTDTVDYAIDFKLRRIEFRGQAALSHDSDTENETAASCYNVKLGT